MDEKPISKSALDFAVLYANQFTGDTRNEALLSPTYDPHNYLGFSLTRHIMVKAFLNGWNSCEHDLRDRVVRPERIKLSLIFNNYNTDWAVAPGVWLEFYQDGDSFVVFLCQENTENVLDKVLLPCRYKYVDEVIKLIECISPSSK